MTEYKNEIYVETPEIFDYQLNLEYLVETLEGILYHIVEDKIRRVIDTEAGTTLVDITGNDDSITIVYLAGTEFTEAHTEQIIDYMENWFDLKTNLEPFYELAKEDAVLKEPMKHYYGLRNMGFPNLFESLVNAIVGQQINVGFAYTLKQEFVESYGERISYEGKEYYVFPTPKRIAGIPLEDFNGFRATKRKKEYILGVAKLMTSGELSKNKLLEFNDAIEVEKELVKIKGIGPWTAQAVAMRCLKFTNALPIEDIGLINAIKKQLHMDRKPTKDEIRKLAENWKGYESYATFYLWKSLYS